MVQWAALRPLRKAIDCLILQSAPIPVIRTRDRPIVVFIKAERAEMKKVREERSKGDHRELQHP